MLVLLSEEVLGYNTQAVLQVHLMVVVTTALGQAALRLSAEWDLPQTDLAVLYL
jgi:hypothetical protein